VIVDQVPGGPVPAPHEPAAAPLAAIQRFAGNRAVAALLGGGPQREPAPQPVAPQPVADTAPADVIVTARPGPVPSLEDPDFNPTTRAHDLIRAIDSAEHTYRLKSGLGGPEDVEAERRKIDFPVALAALDGLTASQVQRVEEVFLAFDKISQRECLFGLGESGRRADLTADQVARFQVLLRGVALLDLAEPGTVPAAAWRELCGELRPAPPTTEGRVLFGRYDPPGTGHTAVLTLVTEFTDGAEVRAVRVRVRPAIGDRVDNIDGQQP
jgi:hypothetical protein